MFCWNWAGFWRATQVKSVVEVNSPVAGNITASHVVSLLKRFSDELKRNMRCRTDPGFPTPGVRMTVVYTNSLKLEGRGNIGAKRRPPTP